MKQRRGFTLIELIVALAVFAVLALLAYGGLNTMLNSRALTDQQADALRELQLAYRNVERDIEQWVPRDIRNEFCEVSPAISAGSDVNAALELTRGGWRNPAEQPRSTLQRVAYAVQDDKLVRLTWLSLDHAPNEQPNTQELLSGVSELRLRFLDSANAWQDRWPPTETPTTAVPPGGTAVPVPPLAIEWILVTERWGELRWLFRLPG
jgi:general secretion pathway protein J